MTSFIRFSGWAANVLLAALLIDGIYPWIGGLGLHIRWGLGVCLFLPLIYLLPYFHLIGVGARLKAKTESGGEDVAQAFQLALRLKARLFLPALLAVVLCITGPILGFFQMGGRIPPMVHGIFMTVFIVVHVVTWARSLFILGLAGELNSFNTNADVGAGPKL